MVERRYGKDHYNFKGNHFELMGDKKEYGIEV